MPRQRKAPAKRQKRKAPSDTESEVSISSMESKSETPVDTSDDGEEQPELPGPHKAGAQVLNPLPSLGFGPFPNVFSKKSDLSNPVDLSSLSKPVPSPMPPLPEGPKRQPVKRRKTKKTEVADTKALLTDPTVSKEIKLEELDLNVSYVDAYKSVAPARPPRQQRWRHRGSQPLVDPMKFPAGWNSNEPDLDPDDFEAQIARCDERIKDNIVPHFFEARKREHQDVKEAIETWMKGEPKGLSRKTYERLDTLKFIQTAISKPENDPLSEKKNVTAIINAYRKGTLEWISGLVTYWSDGKQLCEPRPFDWDEFDAMNKAYSGHKAFWVEGYKFHVRFPGHSFYAELEFLHDTGASDMGIYQDDLPAIMGPSSSPYLRVAGYTRIVTPGQEPTPNNSTVLPMVAIEATMVTEHEDPTKERLRMTSWTRAWTTVNVGRANKALGAHRLDGPWLRHRLYMGSAPDGFDQVHVATSKNDLDLKKVDLKKTPGLVNDPPRIPAVPGAKMPVAGARDQIPMPNLGSIRRFGRAVFTDQRFEVD
ncbi:uncharacterized protein N7496_006263 [Penicillium cataractarum]|uniref:Uncharacterized protein n=1 Tax=Penicillium cataractarum TaxID=2100454 RepID=A0A9W9S179_9EURO|nr:uncharacterized protein N7496_006263 [Penicillium cataractarum]KAJ5370171.1 hypothetical protein N7496_006263 [Penicillium cataractarum]